MTSIKYLPVVFSIIACFFIACDEKILTGTVDCAECENNENKPEIGKLYVYLTFNDSIDEIPLVLYKGDFEDNNIDFIDTAWAEGEYPYWVTVDVGKEYSVRAEYRLEGKTIYAVDGTRPRAKAVIDECNYDCWIVDNNTLDLRIKEGFLEQ